MFSLAKTLQKINDLSTEVIELKRIFENSQREIDEVEAERGSRECDAAKSAAFELLPRICASGRDDGSRRNNLRTDGLEETHGETGEQSIKVQAFLNEQLNLEDVPRDHVHRVGQPRDRRLRMILARFSRPVDRDAATPNARKLRGSVFICEDLRPESQRLKKERYDDHRKAKSEGKIFPTLSYRNFPSAIVS